MRRKNFINLRFFISIFVLTWFSYVMYYQTRTIPNQFQHQSLALIFGTIYFLSILLNPFFIYISLSLKGMRQICVIGFSIIIPLIWMVKGIFILLESHPFIESIYWLLNPMYFFYLCILTIQLGFATVISRLILKRQDENIDIFTPGSLIAIAASVLIMVSISVLIGGENINSLYLEGYRFLFGDGG